MAEARDPVRERDAQRVGSRRAIRAARGPFGSLGLSRGERCHPATLVAATGGAPSRPSELTGGPARFRHATASVACVVACDEIGFTKEGIARTTEDDRPSKKATAPAGVAGP